MALQCVSEATAQGGLFSAALRARRSDRVALMSLLSEAHVHGMEVNWRAVFADGTAPLPDLPTYAFARQRYWPTTPRPASDARSLGQSETQHPVLGAAVSIAAEDGGWLFTARLSAGAHPWIDDHTVMGAKLLPASAVLDLALAAASNVGSMELQRLEIENPLVLEDGRAEQLQLSLSAADSAGSSQLAIHTRSETEAADQAEQPLWRLYATGVLVSAEGGVGDSNGSRPWVPTELEQLATLDWPPEGAEEMTPDAFYDQLLDRGCDFGPAFQVIRQAWRVGDRIFAEVALPEELASEASDFCIHPALLECALYVLQVFRALDRPARPAAAALLLCGREAVRPRGLCAASLCRFTLGHTEAVGGRCVWRARSGDRFRRDAPAGSQPSPRDPRLGP